MILDYIWYGFCILFALLGLRLLWRNRSGIPWPERQLARLARLHRWIGALVCAWDAAIVDYRARMRCRPEPLECVKQREAMALTDELVETGVKVWQSR